MGLGTVEAFIRLVGAVANADDLADAMSAIAADLGFEYFALAHHIDLTAAGATAIRLHNYPPQWADYYEANGLGVCDPVHRASHKSSVGFRWSRIPSLVRLTPRDRQMLDRGRAEGIGDGFTVPTNVPGESFGSCSFANQEGRSVGEAMLPLAQLAGAFAFEAARRLWHVREDERDAPLPTLTDRQRDCLLWAARGKSDWEIGRILGVSEETVTRHMKLARERYGVEKRTLLAIRALFDGTLSFTDIFKR
ncbi:MAG TPA: LuxR family transcriptional regulator [Sphingomonas sp.]|uniref:LuxR family transcriptional regulator n=1 Tax=Sphingomonas sp. TaxID=28214 RepID=UPI002C085A18|nr:LuxR family transcriptional regulator [Sphingomonas sp.]HMI20857.1 LuxR family transcriptional regulator [Sphingomonas sp.]